MNVADELFAILSDILDDKTLALAREIYDTISNTRAKRESKKRAACWAVFIASKKLGHTFLIRDIGASLGLTDRECVRASKEFGFSHYYDVELYTEAAAFMRAKWPTIIAAGGETLHSLLSVEESLVQWESIKTDASLKRVAEQRLAAAYTLYLCRASILDVTSKQVQAAFCVGPEVECNYLVIAQLLAEERNK